jgi:hypothetical protein
LEERVLAEGADPPLEALNVLSRKVLWFN